MFRFGEDLFFVGQASCAKTPEEGRQRAFQRGVQELLNYTQARSTAGVEIATQMVFEEAPAPGCPPHTVTVWRLLRVDADKVAALPKGVPHRVTPEPTPEPATPTDMTPRIGMSREEVLERFGRPWSISMRKDGTEILWSYPRFGLTLTLDEDNILKRWRLAGPQGREEKARELRPKVEKGAPTLDLTARLRSLEKTPAPLEGIPADTPRFAPTPSEVSLPAERHPQRQMASHAFPPAFRKVSGLATAQSRFGTNGLAPPVMKHPRCDVGLYSLSIQHLSDGSGPQISSDNRFSTATEAQFRMAIKAAAKASGYDARFLAIRLSIKLPPTLEASFPPTEAIDAEGSVVSWAVTIASAILNHPMHPDVAVIGTMDSDLHIGPVDDLETRIGGCRQSSPLKLVLSASQNSFDLTMREMGYGLTLTQVDTLAEAYEAATGEGLPPPQ